MICGFLFFYFFNIPNVEDNMKRRFDERIKKLLTNKRADNSIFVNAE